MTIFFLFVVFFHVSGFLSSINAIMSTRTPQGAIAWAVFLISFPYVAVPAYWILGRDRFRGYIVARRDSQDKLSQLVDRVQNGLSEFCTQDESDALSANNSVATRLTGMPFLQGNSVQLLKDGEATFNSILQGLERARKFVLFQFFIIKNDEIGQEIKRGLIARAALGVRIYFLYDEIGSHQLSGSYLQELKNAGISVNAFNTRKGPSNRFQLNFRNHRKLVVIDASEAWIGGHNVGDEYLGRDPKFGHWRDTHVHIKGPAAIASQLSFLQDWYWATDSLLELDWTPHRSESNLPVLIAATGPADQFETASLLFTHAINSAQERIWIASPYFVPDEAVMQALKLASTRGVDVRILIPDKPDHLGPYLAAFAYQLKASGTGVKFYRYTNGFMHQKILLQDNLVSSVGSANFDNRSFRLNFEISAIIADADFSRQVEAMLQADFEAANLMQPFALTEKPYWFQLAVNLARLASPLQ